MGLIGNEDRSKYPFSQFPIYLEVFEMKTKSEKSPQVAISTLLDDSLFCTHFYKPLIIKGFKFDN